MHHMLIAIGLIVLCAKLNSPELQLAFLVFVILPYAGWCVTTAGSEDKSN